MSKIWLEQQRDRLMHIFNSFCAGIASYVLSTVQCHTYACRLRCVFMRATRDLLANAISFISIHYMAICMCKMIVFIAFRAAHFISSTTFQSLYSFLSCRVTRTDSTRALVHFLSLFSTFASV